MMELPAAKCTLGVIALSASACALRQIISYLCGTRIFQHCMNPDAKLCLAGRIPQTVDNKSAQSLEVKRAGLNDIVQTCAVF